MIPVITFGLLPFVLILLAIWDFRYQIIPDSINAALFILAAASLALVEVTSLPDAVLGASLGALIAAAVRIVFERIRGIAGLGLGDVKFICASGLLVGATGLPWVILVASISGLGFAFAALVAGKRIDRRTRIAFGPHLALGLYATWIFKISNMM